MEEGEESDLEQALQIRGFLCQHGNSRENLLCKRENIQHLCGFGYPNQLIRTQELELNQVCPGADVTASSALYPWRKKYPHIWFL